MFQIEVIYNFFFIYMVVVFFEKFLEKFNLYKILIIFLCLYVLDNQFQIIGNSCFFDMNDWLDI